MTTTTAPSSTTDPTGSRSTRRLLPVVLVLAVALDVTYWTLWALDRSAVASLPTRAYVEFEQAFPLADAWLGLVCVLALVALARRRPTALLWLLVAGGMGVYLGSMDLLYDLEHGVFTRGGAGAFELVVVVLTWAFALVVLTTAWRDRDALLRSDRT